MSIVKRKAPVLPYCGVPERFEAYALHAIDVAERALWTAAGSFGLSRCKDSVDVFRACLDVMLIGAFKELQQDVPWADFGEPVSPELVRRLKAMGRHFPLLAYAYLQLDESKRNWNRRDIEGAIDRATETRELLSRVEALGAVASEKSLERLLSEQARHAVSFRLDQILKPGFIDFCKELVQSGKSGNIRTYDDLMNTPGYDCRVSRIGRRTVKEWAKSAGISFRPGAPRKFKCVSRDKS